MGALRTEVHPYVDFGVAECIALPERFGYRAWEVPDPSAKWGMAVRSSP